MAENDANRWLVVAVVALFIALVVVLVLWLQERQEAELEVDVGAAQATPSWLSSTSPSTTAVRSPVSS